MKIKNVEKFREELFKAMKDAYLWDKLETPEATWKGDFDDYEDSMKEYSHYKFVNGEAIRISLAQPMIIYKSTFDKETKKFKHEKELYFTVDENGVTFYRSNENEFSYAGDLDAGLYKNKLSFTMALVDRINSKLSK